VGLDCIKIFLIGLGTGGDPGIVDRADTVGFRLKILDDGCVPANVVCIVVRGDEMIDPGDIVCLEILQDILTVIVVVASIDEHCVAVGIDDKGTD